VADYFVDTSALIKRYLKEEGTEVVRDIIRPTSGNRIHVSQIASIEVVSAFARQRREKSITDIHLLTARRMFERHMSFDYVVLRLSDEITAMACDLLEKHKLRSLDAIQLASAFIANDQLIRKKHAPLMFVCADHRLLTAASEAGLAILEPK
jgi:predicted nucleic acid-binding protein